MCIVNCEFFILCVCFQSFVHMLSNFSDGYAKDVIDTFTKCKQCISILACLLFVVCCSRVVCFKMKFHEEHKEHEEQHNRAINANGFWCWKMSKRMLQSSAAESHKSNACTTKMHLMGEHTAQDDENRSKKQQNTSSLILQSSNWNENE